MREETFTYVTLKLKTLNAAGEKRTAPETVSIRKTDSGKYMVPLGTGMSAYVDSSLLRELADHLEAQEAEDATREAETTEGELGAVGAGSNS